LSIYHITTRADWDAAVGAGWYEPPSLAGEGFIHCSSLDQVVHTANLLFRGQQGLTLLAIDTERLLAELLYEAPAAPGQESRDTALFPHIYGPLNLDAVTDVVAFPAAWDGSFALPPQLGDQASMR
jgi:uncharacterized protein (DUF952 family)